MESSLPPLRIGLVGGMSWESSALYYRLLNQAMQREQGRLHNAESVMVTLDFQQLVDAAECADWPRVTELIGTAVGRLEAAEADFFLLTANTAHQVFAALSAYSSLPGLHIGTATARALTQAGHQRVGIVGTRHVTESDFYIDWMKRNAGIQIVVPEAEDRQWLDTAIFEELARGSVTAGSQARFLGIIDKMQRAGLNAVVMACTELPLLLANGCTEPALPCYDTVALHVEMAVDIAMRRMQIPSEGSSAT